MQFKFYKKKIKKMKGNIQKLIQITLILSNIFLGTKSHHRAMG